MMNNAMMLPVSHGLNKKSTAGIEGMLVSVISFTSEHTQTGYKILL